MEEKLITAVSGFPELYDSALAAYKDTNSRNDAWKMVAAIVGESDVACKKRWRNLRDVYLRERRKKRTRSGAGATAKAPWRYMAIMGFLAPFVEHRATPSNMKPTTAVNRPVSRSSCSLVNSTPTTSQPQASQPLSATERNSHSVAGTPATSQPEASQPETSQPEASQPEISKLEASQPASAAERSSRLVTGTSATSQPETSQPSGAAERGSHSSPVFQPGPSILQSRRLLVGKSLQLIRAPQKFPLCQTTPNTHNTEPDEDELFFKSLLPDLRSLPRKRKALVKLKIHQLIFEAMQEDETTVNNC